jgi:hypothetical protein
VASEELQAVRELMRGVDLGDLPIRERRAAMGDHGAVGR